MMCFLKVQIYLRHSQSNQVFIIVDDGKNALDCFLAYHLCPVSIVKILYCVSSGLIVICYTFLTDPV